MERLTERDGRGIQELKGISESQRLSPKDRVIILDGVDRLAAYEDTGLTPEGIKELQADYTELSNRTYGPLHHEIAEWAKADEAGRLVVLPCKVGDKVYVILEGMGPCVARVQGISMSESCKDTILNFGGYPTVYAWGSGIGKTWFPTRQEAEAYMRKEGAG